MRTTKTSPLGVDVPPEFLELYGVEENVEDNYIEDERPPFVSPTDGILEKEILERLHAEIPANYAIDDYIAAVQLITFSRDTI